MKTYNKEGELISKEDKELYDAEFQRLFEISGSLDAAEQDMEGWSPPNDDWVQIVERVADLDPEQEARDEAFDLDPRNQPPR